MKKKIAVLASIASMIVCQPAWAAVKISFVQAGANVEVTATGTFDLSLATRGGFTTSSASFINTATNQLSIGDSSNQIFNYGFTGPSSIGLGSSKPFNVSTGTKIGLSSRTTFFLDRFYVSNSAINTFARIDNMTLTSVGLTRGTYEYMIGGNSLVITVGQAVAAIPEPATWAMMLVGFSMVGATARYRRRKASLSFA